MAAAPVKSVVPPNPAVCSFCDQPPYHLVVTKCYHLFCETRECLQGLVQGKLNHEFECSFCRDVTRPNERVSIDAHLKVIIYHLSHHSELVIPKFKQFSSEKDECGICFKDRSPIHLIIENIAKERIGEFLCNGCFGRARNLLITGRKYQALTPTQIVTLARQLSDIPSISLSSLALLFATPLKIFSQDTPEACQFCDKPPYEATLTKCGHLFCQNEKNILQQHFDRKGTCPFCKTITNVDECVTIDTHLKVIAYYLGRQSQLVISKIKKLNSDICPICHESDDPPLHFISNNSRQEKAGKFFCNGCFSILDPIPVPHRTYLKLTPFQIVALSRELPPLTPRSFYVSTTVAAMMLMSFCHRVINENSFENQNSILSVTSVPADISIKIFNLFLLLIKKQTTPK